VRVVSARHLECGAATRVRLPGGLPADVVRRVQCVGCAEAYETEVVVELGLEAAERVKPKRRRLRVPRPHLPQLRLIDPSKPAWRLASVPIAAVAVIGGLTALQRPDGTVASSDEPSAAVVERIAAPTPEATVVRLAAVAPPGQPEFEVSLRASGPYRYYLATTVQPDASREAIEGAELVHGSFTPEAAARAGS
jgi:hypothetical protein